MTEKRDYERKLVGGVKKRVAADVKEKRWRRTDERERTRDTFALKYL